MKKIFFSLLVVFITSQLFSQDYKFGKVSKEELEEAYYPLDSSANAAILYKKRRSHYDYNHEGVVVVSEFHFRIKIYNSEGFKWATEEIELYNAKNLKEMVSGLKAVTYNLENGSVVDTKLNKKDIFNEEKNKFIKLYKFTMPNLKEGSIVEWKYKVTSPVYWKMDEVVLQYAIPVKKYEGKIELLEYFNFNKRMKGYFSFPIIESSRRNSDLDTNDKLYKINANNVAALKEEPHVSNINNYRAGVVFEVASIQIPGRTYKSYASNWNDVTKTVYKSSRFGGELDKKSFLKEDIAQLKTQFTTPSEKIVGSLEFVKSKVKWNDYYGKYVHEGVKNAYKKGVGNSGEINLLLVTVLREMGLNANPVIMSSRKNGVPILPTDDGLNYVIAAVESEGNTILLDATEKFSTPNVLPMRTLNWKGRLIRENGSSEWIDLIPKTLSATSSMMNITIDEEGLVEGMVRTQYKNLNALNYRDENLEQKEEDVISALEKENGGIEISEFKLTNKTDIYKPIVENYKFVSEDLVEVVGNNIYFKPLFFNATTESPFKLEKREYPIDFGSPFSEKYIINVAIPEGYVIESVPKSMAIALPNKYGIYKFNISTRENKISIFSHLTIKTGVYPSQNYAEMKEFFKLLVSNNLERIVLKKG